jgi:uncharacterized zinc-type alcohol dehydrogenase-like protein
VTAFTGSASKADEAKRMGAHAVLDTHSNEQISKAAGSFNFILSTIAASSFDLTPYLQALAPKGRLHSVGIIPQISVPITPLLMGQRSISSSPAGPPAILTQMLEFCARHGIAPITEDFPMSKANEALAHLEAGKARYRIVLTQDLQ